MSTIAASRAAAPASALYRRAIRAAYRLPPEPQRPGRSLREHVLARIRASPALTTPELEQEAARQVSALEQLVSDAARKTYPLGQHITRPARTENAKYYEDLAAFEMQQQSPTEQVQGWRLFLLKWFRLKV
ncbi:hypothetical protein RI367_002545 [Sorochytrium milnesiophthora]